MSPLGLFLGLVSSSFAYENIALNKPAFQQNRYPGLPSVYSQASNAVDGEKSNLSWQGGECTISNNYQQTATWWVNLTSILSIHHIMIYYRTGNTEWGTSSGFTPRFLGFSLYVSNTTNRSEGTLCYKDTEFNTSTIPAVFTTTCAVHGQYVIYYNERLQGVTYPGDYSEFAFNELCEVEVYGCPHLGYYGSECSIPCPYYHCLYCHIETGTCLGCAPGYRGPHCDLVCATGFYGDTCKRKCGHCADLSQCHHVTGLCSKGCKPGFKGNGCLQKCSTGFYGEDCQKQCGHCTNLTQCDHVNGLCLKGCKAGYKGHNCLQPCDGKKFGKDCTEDCGNCLQDKQCFHINGTCINGCDPGFRGLTCTEECPDNYFGLACKEICGVTCKGCSKVTGVCENGCHSGWRGSFCREKCDIGYYGNACSSKCGRCVKNESCHHINGHCLQGCEPGYEEPFCNEECIDGNYGINCTVQCGNCLDPSHCFHETGTCLTGCRSGFRGILCKEVIVPLTQDWQTGFFGVLALLCFLLIGILIAILKKRKNKNLKMYQRDESTKESQHDLIDDSEQCVYQNVAEILNLRRTTEM